MAVLKLVSSCRLTKCRCVVDKLVADEDCSQSSPKEELDHFVSVSSHPRLNCADPVAARHRKVREDSIDSITLSDRQAYLGNLDCNGDPD